MTIIDTTTVAVLLTLVGTAIALAVIATGVVLARAYATRPAAPRTAPAAPSYPVYGRLAH